MDAHNERHSKSPAPVVRTAVESLEVSRDRTRPHKPLQSRSSWTEQPDLFQRLYDSPVAFHTGADVRHSQKGRDLVVVRVLNPIVVLHEALCEVEPRFVPVRFRSARVQTMVVKELWQGANVRPCF
jgi:hypothetical protein